MKQFLKSPLTIGSICPSSRFLTRALAEMAMGSYTDTDGLIIDLGAGTGVISRELLNLGVSPERIVALDISENFRDIFNSQCYPVDLRVGDARKLYKIICGAFPEKPLLAIISSLPLKSMPKSDIAAIMLEIWKLMRERGGILLQYTYALWRHSALSEYGFSLESARYIVKNIPPTLIEKYFLEV